MGLWHGRGRHIHRRSSHANISFWHSFPSFPPTINHTTRMGPARKSAEIPTNSKQSLSLFLSVVQKTQNQKSRARPMQLSNRQSQNHCDFGAGRDAATAKPPIEVRIERPSDIQRRPRRRRSGFLGNCLGCAVGGMSIRKGREGKGQGGVIQGHPKRCFHRLLRLSHHF